MNFSLLIKIYLHHVELVLIDLYLFEYSLVFVDLYSYFVFEFFEKVLVYLDHKHPHHHHRHQDVQQLNFQYLDHVEMLFPILDVVEMGYIHWLNFCQLLFVQLMHHSQLYYQQSQVQQVHEQMAVMDRKVNHVRDHNEIILLAKRRRKKNKTIKYLMEILTRFFS